MAARAAEEARLRFFASPAEFRGWLGKNHAKARELTAGFYKSDTGRGGLTYAQALDEALCWGWIDGVRRRVDDQSYCIRFAPRKKGSIWSKVNLRHFERLQRDGRVAAPGLRAYEERDPARSGVYSFENAPRELPPEYRRRFGAKAWAWFNAQPPWYRRTAAFWVMTAKKEGTRLRRLSQLIAASAKGRRAPPFTSPSG